MDRIAVPDILWRSASFCIFGSMLYKMALFFNMFSNCNCRYIDLFFYIFPLIMFSCCIKSNGIALSYDYFFYEIFPQVTRYYIVLHNFWYQFIYGNTTSPLYYNICDIILILLSYIINCITGDIATLSGCMHNNTSPYAYISLICAFIYLTLLNLYFYTIIADMNFLNTILVYSNFPPLSV